MKLNKNFLAELFKLYFTKIEMTEICNTFLKYEFLPKEQAGYKILLREGIQQYTNANVLPSIGVIAQKYPLREDVQLAIDEVKKAQIVDNELILNQLESYIRDSEFQILNQKIVDLYKEGKRDEAISLSAEESLRINQFSIRGEAGKFMQVFGSFADMMKQNESSYDDNRSQAKIAFGIDCLDDITFGGMDRTDVTLWIMRSGVGKSTVLRHHALEASLNGEHVLHIQLEGTRKEVFNKYSQMWTNSSYNKIQKGYFSDKEWDQLQQTIKEMSEWQRDIDIYAFERFGEASVIEIRELIREYFKIRGYYPTVLIIDSLDLLASGESKKIDTDPSFVKYKLQKCAQRLKNIAIEFDLAVYTATQTGDVPFEVWNDPNRVIDRSYTEGDKTLVKPFSFVFTGNVTINESQNNELRIYVDKFRNYGKSRGVYRIKTNFETGRFYDRAATMKAADALKAIEQAGSSAKNRKSKVI